jgi:signal transduction histidine kinase
MRLKARCRKFCERRLIGQHGVWLQSVGCKTDFGIGVLNHAKTEQTEKEKILQLIKKSSADLDEVIHDLINVVQVRSQGENSKSKINVVALLNRVLEHINHDIEDNKIEIVNNVDPDLELEVNDALAYSVLLNVISNSVKYRNNNQPQVLIKGLRRDSQIVLEISDNGMGFNSDLHKDKLFRPFSRLNTILPGKGLGLYLVKIHMESMGGQVGVGSRNGKNSTLRNGNFEVYCRLPFLVIFAVAGCIATGMFESKTLSSKSRVLKYSNTKNYK